MADSSKTQWMPMQAVEDDGVESSADSDDAALMVPMPEQRFWSKKAFRSAIGVVVVLAVLGVVQIMKADGSVSSSTSADVDGLVELDDICTLYRGIWHPNHLKCCPTACGKFCSDDVNVCEKGPGGKDACCSDNWADNTIKECSAMHPAPCMTPFGFSSTTTTTKLEAYEGSFSFSADVPLIAAQQGTRKALASYWGVSVNDLKADVYTSRRLASAPAMRGLFSMEVWTVRYGFSTPSARSAVVEAKSRNTVKDFRPLREMLVKQLTHAGGTHVEDTCTILTFELLTKAAVTTTAVPKDVAKFEVYWHDSGCSSTHVDIGKFDTPGECASHVVSDSRCGNYFSFAPSQTAWGCRCCDKVDKRKHNVYWRTYKLTEAQQKQIT
jgi:hypothetical protein